MSPKINLLKIKYHQNRDITKTGMSPKLNVTETQTGLFNWTFKFTYKSLALIALALFILFILFSEASWFYTEL